VPGEQKQVDRRDELIVGEPVVGVALGDQHRDQVVGGTLTLGRQQRADVRDQVGLRGGQFVATGCPVDHDVRPPGEGVAVLDGHAEQLRDDRDRERKRQLRHQVVAARPGEFVDQPVGDGSDGGRQRLHGAWREGGLYGAPQPGVVGRVDHQHVVPGRLVDVGWYHRPVADGRQQTVLGQAWIGQGPAYVVVPADEPSGTPVEQRQLSDRPLFPEDRKDIINVRAEEARERLGCRTAHALKLRRGLHGISRSDHRRLQVALSDSPLSAPPLNEARA
jgi:hypothetical protein